MGTSTSAGKGKSDKNATRSDSCLNKYPFTPIWSPVMPVPLGRIQIQVRQVIDRIQISIPINAGIWGALRDELSLKGFLFRGEFVEQSPITGKRELKCRFEKEDSQVYLIRPEEGDKAFWYRMVVCQPTPTVQSDLLDILSILPPMSSKRTKMRRPWYVSQVEVALDVRPVETQDLELIRLHLEHGLTIPRVRTAQSFSYEETYYYAAGKNIRKAGHGFRVYLKPEKASPEFVRCEAQLNAGALDQLGLRGRKGLLITPDEVNVFSLLQYLYLDVNRLESGLVAKFGRKGGASNFWKGRILKSGSVSRALDEFRAFDKKRPGIKKERVFLQSPKQYALFVDLAEGFVRQRYRTRPFPS